MPRCAGYKGNGLPCEHIVRAAQSYCYGHDPNRAGERKRNSSKAAKAKVGEIGTIKDTLKQLASDVLTEEVSKEKATVVARIYGVLLRAIHEEREQMVQDEIVERLHQLEQAAS
jgi:hypothetical protein